MTEPTGGELRRCVKCDAWMLADNLPRHSCESVLSHDAEDTQHAALRALVQQWREKAEWEMHLVNGLETSESGQRRLTFKSCADALATLLGATK